MHNHQILFKTGKFSAYELNDDDIPRLQHFYSSNPEFFLMANGMPVRDDEAQREFDELPPAEIPFNQRYIIGFFDCNNNLIGVTIILSDFLAPRVWQISFFMVATSLHATGIANMVYSQLEKWIALNSTNWIRLGIIVNNHKAERFWKKCGYVEVRQRKAVKFGSLIHDLRVMIKALKPYTIDEYKQCVVYDRPDPTQ